MMVRAEKNVIHATLILLLRSGIKKKKEKENRNEKVENFSVDFKVTKIYVLVKC